MTPRLKEQYRNQVAPALMKEFNYRNVMAVPRLRKIVLNMGLGEAIQNAKLLDSATRELGEITGQKPVITRARKSIANFKLRKNMPIGAMVTLRGERMYEFLDRLTNVALPRVRDFRGLSTRARNSYMRSPRSVTIAPMGMFLRSLKLAIDFRARVITGFCPVISASSRVAESSSLAFWIASPSPMFTTILRRRGTAIAFR